MFFIWKVARCLTKFLIMLKKNYYCCYCFGHILIYVWSKRLSHTHTHVHLLWRQQCSAELCNSSDFQFFPFLYIYFRHNLSLWPVWSFRHFLHSSSDINNIQQHQLRIAVSFFISGTCMCSANMTKLFRTSPVHAVCDLLLYHWNNSKPSFKF